MVFFFSLISNKENAQHTKKKIKLELIVKYLSL